MHKNLLKNKLMHKNLQKQQSMRIFLLKNAINAQKFATFME